MEISLKRDGLTLRGTLLKPEGADKCPIAVINHGLMANRDKDSGGMFKMLADRLLQKGVASVRFDFDGHGDSDGDFRDMSVLGELLDAFKIMDYVLSLDWVSDIYIAGHSQGALVGGMMAGYYREHVKKLVLLAPAATIKDDALAGRCFGQTYDTDNLPPYILMRNSEGEEFKLGQTYMRSARTLPVYETTSMFRGKTLIIHGSDDEAVGVIGAKRYKECMDNVTLHIIEGETHGLGTISLDAVISEVTEFLAGENT